MMELKDKILLLAVCKKLKISCIIEPFHFQAEIKKDVPFPEKATIGDTFFFPYEGLQILWLYVRNRNDDFYWKIFNIS